jgi:hypothetical protein
MARERDSDDHEVRGARDVGVRAALHRGRPPDRDGRCPLPDVSGVFDGPVSVS